MGGCGPKGVKPAKRNREVGAINFPNYVLESESTPHRYEIVTYMGMVMVSPGVRPRGVVVKVGGVKVR